ncbi:MAG: hypothetical protein OXC31_01955 [Spirochaetaceae bacterium]|nr:hypothetical protein [Spirochaetaceae bacterium]
MKIPTADSLITLGTEVCQGVHRGRAVCGLLGQPDLISAEGALTAIPKDGDIMGVENELSTLRIGVAILEQVNEPLH